jgi:adenylylsulfate kinase-like enzyme
VAAPLTTCADRDVKGLYARALAGEIPNFTGVSDPYEPPPVPELVLHTDQEAVEDSVERVLDCLERLGLTGPARDRAANGWRPGDTRVGTRQPHP